MENIPNNPGASCEWDVAAPGQQQQLSPGRRREKTKIFCISHLNKRGCALGAWVIQLLGWFVMELIRPEAGSGRRGRLALDKLLYKHSGN